MMWEKVTGEVDYPTYRDSDSLYLNGVKASALWTRRSGDSTEAGPWMTLLASLL